MLAWFKVDDGFGSHPKVMMIPRAERRACLGAWLLAGVWSAQHLTDGRVPSYMLDELGVEVSQRDRLVTVRLWEEDDNGIRFKDWSDHQPTRADVLASREKERRRKEAYRQKKAGISGESPTGTDSDGDEGHQQVSDHPDPTRPDPTIKKEEVAKATSKKRSQGTRLDPQWLPAHELIAQMQDECPSVNLEAEHRVFVDYWIAQPGAKGSKVDWAATWRNWMRRKQNDSGNRSTRPASQPSRAEAANSFIQRLEEQDAARGRGQAADDRRELR